MTGKALWQNLKKLVAYDQELIQQAQAVLEKEKHISEYHHKLSELTEQLSHLKSELFSTKKEADMLQLQANAVREHENQTRMRLENIRDQREYMALEKELSSLIQKRITLDEATIKSWYSLETIQKKYDDAVQNHDRSQTTIKQDITNEEQSITALQEQITHSQHERQTHYQTIPEEWKTRYNRMKNQVEDPIVSLHGISCSSCFYTAPAQDVVKLKKQEILPCRNCYRFLYYDEEQQAAEPKKT